MFEKKYIKKIVTKNIEKHIVTADFETMIVNNDHIPYMFSIYTETNVPIISWEVNLNDKKYVVDMFLLRLRALQKKIKKPIAVYMHNMGNFDGIIIIRYLKKIEKKTKIIIRNNSIYEIKINKDISIRDSYKLLTTSLNKLSKDILGDEKKINIGLFTKKKDIKGNIEKIKKYCIDDSKMLYKILLKVSKELYEEFKINITDGMTISSLAYKLFKRDYYEEDSIEITNRKKNYQYEIIANSYRGGIVNVYKPYGENLYYYDINSSYPFNMLKDMPSGIGKRWERKRIKELNQKLKEKEQRNEIKDIFGFIYLKMKVEKNYIPMIGIRDEEKFTNIYPYGHIETVVFSEELKYAMEVNKIKIIRIITIYEYERKKIFDKYVNTIYNKRLEFQKNKNNTKQMLCKSLLNNLYGRFGMKAETEETLIVTKKEKELLELFCEVKEVLKYNDEQIIININTEKCYIEKKEKLKMIKNINEKELEYITKKWKWLWYKKINIETSPHISSAITAYSRIHLDKFKRKILKKRGEIYYCDTDSIVCNIKIDKNISNELGDWKCEHEIEKGWFISPKIYIIKTKNNQTIIKFKGLRKNTIEKLKEKDKESGKYLYEKITEVMFEKEIKKMSFLEIKGVQKEFRNMVIKGDIEGTKELSFKINKRKKTFKKNVWENTEPLKVKYNKVYR